MQRQNQCIQNIIKSFISKSRKNINDSNLSYPAKLTRQSYQQSHEQDKEFIIKRSDLKEFVEKIANETYQQNIRVQRLQQQIQNLKNANLMLTERVKEAILLGQQNFRRSLAELQIKYQGQKKKRQHLDREVKWSNNRIKQQLSQIQRMRHLILTKDHIIHKMKEKDSQNLGQQIYQNSRIKQIHNQEKIISKYFDFELKQRKQSLEEERRKFVRHSDQDRKDKLLKQLAQKCLFLEAHIETLMRKILGQFVNEKAENIRKSNELQSEDFSGDKKYNTKIKHIENESSMISLDIE